ncbi:MAG: type II secretion system protein [Elusimicrobia bacterium]|nr:type II secretion system protein [Elusimicrobiota bacterium]
MSPSRVNSGARAREHPRKRARACAGFTLVEVVIGTLLTAIVVTAVFSVTLTLQRGGGRAERQFVANQAAQKVLETLKDYVTADIGDPAQGPGGNWCFPGANPAAPTEGTYCGPGCLSQLGCTSPSYCYALDTNCDHFVRGAEFLPSNLRSGSAYDMTLKYTVEDETNPTGNPILPQRPQVNVTVTWQEP